MFEAIPFPNENIMICHNNIFQHNELIEDGTRDDDKNESSDVDMVLRLFFVMISNKIRCCLSNKVSLPVFKWSWQFSNGYAYGFDSEWIKANWLKRTHTHGAGKTLSQRDLALFHKQ